VEGDRPKEKFELDEHLIDNIIQGDWLEYLKKIKNVHADLTAKIIKLLENDPRQAVKDLAKKLGISRTFLAGYLKALENQGCVKSKRIGPARAYFIDRLPER